MNIEKFADLIDAILDQSSDNELEISIKRSGNWTETTIKDSLSDIGYVREIFVHEAVDEMLNQLQSFVDEQVQP